MTVICTYIDGVEREIQIFIDPSLPDRLHAAVNDLYREYRFRAKIIHVGWAVMFQLTHHVEPPTFIQMSLSISRNQNYITWQGIPVLINPLLSSDDILALPDPEWQMEWAMMRELKGKP